MKSMLIVAENEFSAIARNPIVILFGALMLAFALINAVGCSAFLPQYHTPDHISGIMIGVANFSWIFSMFFAFLSMCIGITSIADERSKGSFSVLFTKPIYRRDVVAGKFIGISVFMFLLIMLTMALFVSLMIVTYAGPESIIDLMLRLFSFAVLLFVNCCFTLGLVMCLGIFLGKSEALIVSLSFISIEWLTIIGSVPASLGNLRLIDPQYLYNYAIGLPQSDIFTTTLPLNLWFSDSLPYIVLMIAEVIIIVLIDCMLFNREKA